MTQTDAELSRQWANPGDILSLLLLLGGDIVQKAIDQLVGHQIRIPLRLGGSQKHAASLSLPIAPVAFSFGWAAYAYLNLLAAVGDMRLMPTTNTEAPSIVVNCANGFTRETRSWVLGRLLRDHEIRNGVDSRSKRQAGRAESIRIDVSHLGSASTPRHDWVWRLGWCTVLAQMGIALLPWGIYGDWGILLVTLCGNILAAVTCAMPQWRQEKWGDGRKLRRDKVTCLTRGNGHSHIMVFIGAEGSWDLERLATGMAVPRAETRWISLVLAVAWTGLLISVSGLRQHTWYLIGIGGIGMLQNVLAAGMPRAAAASNFHLTEFARAPTIIGRRDYQEDDADANVNLEEDLHQLTDIATWASEKPETPSALTHGSNSAPPADAPSMPRWLSSMSKSDGVPIWLEPLQPDRSSQAIASDPPPSLHSLLRSRIQRWYSSTDDPDKQNKPIIYAIGVQGALMELEKWVPTAGLALVQIFFPVALQYNDESIRDNVAKKFWKRAYHTRSVRKRAEEKRREVERRGWREGGTAVDV